MCAEMVAMLLASIIQGHVVSVYNTEKQEACEELHQVHHAAQSTAAPQVASLQETVKKQTKTKKQQLWNQRDVGRDKAQISGGLLRRWGFVFSWSQGYRITL